VGTLKLGEAPYRVKIKILNTQWLLYGKEPAMAHGFNGKKIKSIGSLWLEI
jgi:hypothetical protein